MDFLQAGAVSLVPLDSETDSHVDVYLRGHSNPEMRATGPYEGTTLVCAISAEGETVGIVGTYIGDERARVAGLYYLVLPEYQGNGYATEAARLLTEFAFVDLNAQKIAATVIASNAASERVLEKLGFQQEGRRRNQMYKDGKYRDVTEWGLLESEFDDERDSTERDTPE
jgi:RimJ/RimL family protein N-acetyltransferase